MAKKDKQDAPRDVVDLINTILGDQTAIRLGQGARQEYDVISTGSVGLDVAIGAGGLPRGRIVELFGPESSGKTTIALHVAANAQKKGLQVGFVDAEHALDISYAAALGVDTEQLVVCQPDYGEQGLEVTRIMCESGQIGVVVVDSVAALTPKAELEGEMGDSHMGLHARLMSQACRKLVATTNRTDTLLLFINQIRTKIGVQWGSPNVTTGGNALKFYASVRLDVKRIGKVGEGENTVANRTRVKVVKNKVAPPFKEVEFDIDFGKGISKSGEIIDMGVELGLIEKAGAWLSYGGEKLAQGRSNAKSVLDQNPALLQEIEEAVRLCSQTKAS